jgi:hypothetical protein
LQQQPEPSPQQQQAAPDVGTDGGTPRAAAVG